MKYTLRSLFLLMLATAVHGADWPQFRGPNGLGFSDETGLPTTWDLKTGKNVVWKAPLPGRGISCPVVVKNRVYLTSSSGYRLDRLHVLCFDVDTGKKLWERQFAATGSTHCHQKTSMAGPTPVADEERVYALFGTGDLACFDSDGNLIWYRSLVGDYPTVANALGLAASPVVWKNLLFVPMENVGDESFAAALDVRTGQNRWKTDRTRDINWITPLVLTRSDGADVLFQSGNALTAYDAETGSRRWEYQGSLSTVASPFPLAGNVLASGGEAVVVKPQPENGTAEAQLKTSRLRSGYTTPLGYRGRLYAVSGNFLNHIDAADGKAGEAVRLPGKGPYWASPVAGDGKVYLVAEDGSVFVVKAGVKPQLLATNAVGEECVATPAIAQGSLFLRTSGHLIRVREQTGK